MRVLVWQWGRFGAGPRYALEMAHALSRHCGHETLLSLAEGAELLQNSALRSAVDLPLHTYASPREFALRTLGISNVLRSIVERLRATPPDVSIVTMMGYWDIFLARHLQQMGVPLVVVIHDAEVHPGDRFHLAVQLQRHLARKADGVITLTNYVAAKVRARLPLEGKVLATVPLAAFDFADLDLPPPRLPEPAAARPLRLLLAGRLKRYKGLQLLTEAINSLDDVPLELRVVGAPQERRCVEALAALPRVTLDLGWKGDREIFDHLDWADACVLPYVEASQSGLAPQCFKRGRPLIVTPVGGLPEQIRDGETGLIAEAVSPESLAAAIRQFAEDRPFLRRCAENALREAEGELSWAQIAPKLSDVLTKAAQCRRN